MYVSSFLSLQTALSGVEAAQEELNTTGNNIANANTAGYEDQTVTLTQTSPLTIAGDQSANALQLGTGVNASGVANASNPYLDTAARTQSAATSSANTMQSYTSQLQSLLGENNNNKGAISSELQTFWGDWNSLSNNPQNAGAAQSVIDDGQTLAQGINQLAGNISNLQSQAQTQYSNITADAPGGQVYDDVTQLASLNHQIAQATQGGYGDNQLLDQRNAVIDDLSGLASVQVTNNPDGTVNLSFGGITNLVQGSTVNWPASGTTTLGSGGFSFPGTASSVGGTLGALLSFAGSGGTLDQVSGQLDGVATQLATSVNSLTATSTSGVTAFFTLTTGGAPGTAAASLAVNPTLVANPSEVPVTATTNPGANDIAVAVSQLSGGAPDQAYGALVETVGGLAQAASNNATNETALATQIDNQRQSVEGVDMNQEMANLVQEQQAYEASAKVMSAFSTMMSSLMSVVGQ
ncbi:flagellar hook-associated protein FlgK [Conexibacter sp. DBS9H8]|uniref:flagellar hook-associated protein FlgK n=1 Tax=Conexibacter sp. DBS9H8 TaxID=2937801 RepID=UPI00200CF003|nr:flagellar hook-associated protein FlgK [Conexibacter sp. DBS9H8]